jgi:hypothetical protein
MTAWDLAARSQAHLIESRHRVATSSTSIVTTLVRLTRRRRLEGGSDAADGGLGPPAVCVFCNKPIVKPTQNSVTINERAYHTDCWERLETRRARS